MSALNPDKLLRLRGTRLLALFLFATLALAVWLGWQAADAAGSHRRTAEGVMTDYASTAAWAFSRAARGNLADFLRIVFDEVPRRPGSEPVSPRLMAQEMERATRAFGCRCDGLEQRTTYYRLDLRGGPGESVPEGAPPQALAQLEHRIVTHRDTLEFSALGLLSAPAGEVIDDPAMIGYVVTRDAQRNPSTAFVFVAPLDAMTELFARWYDRTPLLPPAIARSMPNDSLLHIVVSAPGSEVPLFESTVAYPATFRAVEHVGSRYGSLTVEATIRPDAADELVIGGLPRARLPLLMVLMLLTLGVGLGALIQIRREDRLARLRDDFVSGVSHEFRTPLTQIRMFAELLSNGKLRTNEERSRSVGVIDREARRLTHLVENTLVFSDLRRDPNRIGSVEAVELAPALKEVADGFAPLAAGRGASFHLDVSPGAAALCAKPALHRMMTNLLDNALKYGPDGQIVRISVEALGSKVRISVEDEGPGIPSADRNRVFQPYLRLERDLAGDVRGSGLGLAVVAELAERYGGRVWVGDAPERGARFVLELPASPRAAPVASEAVPLS